MVKEAFQRLSPERQEELLYKGMMLYLKNPYDQVTVRMLAAAMEINMATFYRYFDEKEDLSLLILRRIQRKRRAEFIAHILRDVVSRHARRPCAHRHFLPFP